MPTALPAGPHLCPNGLRMAADAYDAALTSISENIEVEPYSARRLLARYIIYRALAGDRDADRMREGALEYLRGARATEGSRGGRPKVVEFVKRVPGAELPRELRPSTPPPGGPNLMSLSRPSEPRSIRVPSSQCVPEQP